MIDIIKELQNSKKILKDCLSDIPGEVSKDEKKFIVNYIANIKAAVTKIDKD